MSKQLALILFILCASLMMSAFEDPGGGGDVNVNAHELLLSLEVTLSSNVSINPNINGAESDIINGTSLKVKNNTSTNIEVYVSDISSDYLNEFVSYSNNEIMWKNLGRSDTLKYIAFSIDDKDILPKSEIGLGEISNKWSSVEDEKYFNVNVKSGYSWKSGDTLNRTYPITMIFRVGGEEIPKYIETFSVGKPTYFERADGAVVVQSDAEIPFGHMPISYGFIYNEGGYSSDIDISSDETFMSELYGLSFNQEYVVVAYVVTSIGTYYSEPEIIYIEKAPTPTISLDNTTIDETVANTGAMSKTITVSLTDGIFIPDVSGKFQIINLPIGLSISTTRLNDTQVRISFVGNAISHTSANNISNAFTAIDKSAIKDNKNFTPTENITSSNISFSFRNTITMSLDKTSIAETTVNDGAFSDTFTVTLTNGTFHADMSTGVTMSNIPTGLTPSVTRLSNTQVRISFTGKATSHTTANNVTNAVITIASSKLLDNLSGVPTSNLTSSNVSFSFANPITMSLDKTTITETTVNDGAFSDTFTITLTNGTFSADMSTGVTASNLPAGLSLSITRLSNTQVRVAFTGKATAHATSNNVSNVTLTVAASKLIDNLGRVPTSNLTSSNLSFNYRNTITMALDKTSITETTANTGAFTDTFTVTLTNGTFATDMSTGVTVTNLPVGLSASITRLSNTQIRVAFTGITTSHTSTNNITNANITIVASKLLDNLGGARTTNLVSSNISFSFRNTITMTLDKTSVVETTVNDGAFSDTFTVTLTNGTFAASITGGITVSGLPAGLTISLTRVSATQARVAFTGKATAHATANNVTTAKINVAASILLDNLSGVPTTALTSSNVSFSFRNTITMTLDKTTVTETTANTGAFTDTFTITLTNGTFHADMSTGITVSGLPAGLTASITRLSNTQVRVAFTGSATSHTSTNNVTTAKINIAASKLIDNLSGVPTIAMASNNLTFSFRNTITMTLDKTSISETAVNDGAFSDTFTITLTNGTFAASITGGITVSGLPAGLTASLTRVSSTQARVAFTGKATAHNVANSITTAKINVAASILLDNLSGVPTTALASNNLTFSFSDPVVTLSSFTASVVGTFSANGSITVGGAITERGFIYIAGSSTPIITTSGVTKIVAGSGTGTFTGSTLNLAESTTYSVRAYVKVGSIYTYSNVITVNVPKAFRYKVDLDYLANNSYQFYASTVASHGFNINWGDGNVERLTGIGIKSHSYSSSGIKEIRIISDNLNPNFYSNSSSICITEVLTPLPSTTSSDSGSIFRGQLYLKSIPSDLFTNRVNTTDFSSTFHNCSSLAGSIPEGLFFNNTNVTTFASTFFNCSSLTGAIPAGLFSKNTAVTNFSSTFYGCNKLTSIPTGLFSKNTSVTTFFYTFRGCSSLTGSIPVGLFDSNSLVTEFSHTFYGCSSLVGTIPAGLFSKNTAVTNFTFTFYGCSSLTGAIPAGLFNNNTKVTNFRGTFYNCNKLTSIPTGLFNNNTLVTNFESTFNRCTALTGSAFDLWNRTNPVPTGTGCFYNATGLTNYASIPAVWKQSIAIQ